MGAVTVTLPLLATGGATTGFEIPEHVVDTLAGGKKPKVTVTLNGRHTYRSSIALMGGKFMLGVSAANRQAASITAGDEVVIELALDSVPREVAVPEDLSAALSTNAEAKKVFESLSYSNRRRHVLGIEDARTPETRARRIAKAIEVLLQGKS